MEPCPVAPPALFLPLQIPQVGRAKERAADQAKFGKKGGAEEGGEEGDAVVPLEPLGNDPTCYLQLAGNDLCRSGDDVERFHEEQTVNTLVLTLRKGRTVTGCIELAAKAQGLGWGVVVAIESAVEAAETDDDFVAHLAVGTKAGQFRGGGLASGENMAKYNALLKISTDAGVPYAGGKFRNFPS